MSEAKLILLGVALLYNILNAEHDAWRIKRHKNVNHAANAGFYCAIIIVGCFFTDWKMVLPMLCLRPLWFDQHLNVRRGVGFTYQPAAPASVIDKTENAIFGHKRAWALSNTVYLIGFVVGVVINW